jgi:hypothetical protein
MILRLMLIMGFLYSTLPLLAQQSKLNKLWESDTTLSVAESVLLDHQHNILFVSCVNGPASDDNHNSFIAKVSLDGKVIDRNFTKQLNATKGMCILGDKLYVTEMKQLVEIDLATGKIVKRYPVKGALFLNDLAADTATGSIYISDSSTEQLWVFRKGEMNVFAKGTSFKNLNALLLQGHNLLIANVTGSFSSLNLKTKQVTLIASLESGIDGITALGKKNYLLTETAGRIWRLYADGRKLLLSDTSKEKVNATDTEYDISTHTLYVPTLFYNTVRAFHVK